MYTYYPLQVADKFSHISESPIDFNLIQQAFDERAGAVVVFSGNVRNHNVGKEVLYLDYEAYDAMANKMIAEIIATAIEKFSLYKAICVHRKGKVALGEAAVIVVTASAHRDEAYEANRYIIDRVKYEAPIWKQEFFKDETSEWSHNAGNRYQENPIVIS